MEQDTPKKKTAPKKTPAKKASSAPAKRGRPPKKTAASATDVSASQDSVQPKPEGILVTANDVVKPDLRQRMLQWFKRLKSRI